ncbi:hypothetical protein [Sinomicrobium weinanense]|uniref:Uncharacterized protein n=1 Tax=Sinomicrobium weinanense TaxID=2842200 RepID=A0A926JNG1_9FLAO|nr:hypothetical protein [Sinomicrobium weinanense]MBC9794399.1 hypothetical protein [Sinomicrobium weinanense]MBU3124306.1 hypothetical protein [Sinomicrobium weinanense]
MENLENYGVRELYQDELVDVNGGINLGDAITLLNGILNIVMGFMEAAVQAVEDYVNSILEGGLA